MVVITAFILTALIRSSLTVRLPEADMTVPEIISYYGYPIEEHIAITADGHHLVLHRIPHGINENGILRYKQRPVIFLQHGFIGSSAVWVTNLPSQSAGFIFADAGLDVWMGNVRGNTYSVNHTSFTRNDDEYWKFSFDEISKYDIETMIDKALNVTGQMRVFYVAHSEGCITMMAKLATDPLFASKVEKFFALGPMTSMDHARGIISLLAKNFAGSIKVLASLQNEFMPHYGPFQRFTKFVCGLSAMKAVCSYFVFQIAGEVTNQWNETRIPVYLSHLPGGSSMANLVHWSQLASSKRLRMFDYGNKYSNRLHYGTPVPPAYEFYRISTSIYLYWSDADWLTDERDVKSSFVDQIRPEYLAENNRLANFSHLDYIWGSQAVELIYKPIIQKIRATTGVQWKRRSLHKKQ